MNILLAIGIGYVLLLLFLFLIQDRMIFFPASTVPYDPSVYDLYWEDVRMETGDGLKLHGWYIPHENSGKILLFSHGNAGNISHRLGFIDSLYREGISTFIYDYRGYGNSEGRPDEEGLYKDIRTAWDYLVDEKSYDEKDIILFGRSLGGAVSARLAQEVQSSGLIIESAFTSVRDIASEIYPFVPASLIRSDFSTVEYLQNINMPVLIMHSRDDAIIGFHHGENLYKAAPEPKYFAELRGGHNDNYMVSADIYFGELKRFIENLRSGD